MLCTYDARMLPSEMLAMQADPASHTLRPVRKPVPVPAAGEVLLKVRCCGVCRTDLHILDGELAPHLEHVVPGHEIVGEVVGLGAGSARFALGKRVGVPWLGRACGHCAFCITAHENLCDHPQFTGYDRDGGYAEYVVADERFCLSLPASCDDLHAAPLLCAGLIGFRTWKLAGGAAARRVGMWGFGAAAHIVCQIAVAEGQKVYAFTRPGDTEGQAFARSLGAVWAGGSDERPPQAPDASLIFAPAGPLVPAALAVARKGGVVVCGGIHMSDIPAFPYELLWGERQLKSVANLTRSDGEEFFDLVARVPVQTRVQAFPLLQANDAIRALREGSLRGAAVLVP